MNLLRTIVSSVWMMHPREAERMLPFVQSFLSGNHSVDLSQFVSKHSARGFSRTASNNTEQRVVVIPVIGVILKYDGECGEMGMMTLERYLDDVLNNPTIGAIVLDIDSGGGQATYMDHIANKIREFKSVKPILVHFSGICASAAYYLASNTTAIYASSKLDEVGSIGTMCSLYKPNEQSTSPYVLVDFYATKSTEKNKMYHDAIAGNDKQLIENLDKYNAEFISNVKQGRPQLSEDAYSGICIYADQAIEIGMIDGIKRLDDVIQEAFSLIQN